MRKVLWFVTPKGLAGAHRMGIHLNQTLRAEGGAEVSPTKEAWERVPGRCKDLWTRSNVPKMGSFDLSSGSCM